MATLTYVYAESTAVLGPLATYAEPHSYDLCARHAERLTVPRGWDAVRLSLPQSEPAPSSDDLEALADAVREAARTPAPAPGGPRAVPRRETAGRGSVAVPAPVADDAAIGGRPGEGRPAGARRGHLRVLSNEP